VPCIPPAYAAGAALLGSVGILTARNIASDHDLGYSIAPMAPPRGRGATAGGGGADTYGTPPGGPNAPRSQPPRTTREPVLRNDPEARQAAQRNGWVETNYKSPQDTKIFRDPKSGLYFTRDRTGHTAGGAWKAARTPNGFGQDKRLGTYDITGKNRLKK